MIRPRACLFLFLFLAVASAPAYAQQKTTLTHEVMTSFLRVGAPMPSPDGKWVVFSVSESDYDPQKESADLWIVPADGSAPARRLTANKGGEGGPAWSPDSQRLAFSARRDDDEVGQIYVLDIARGGDAQRVTGAPTSASAPKWSPDGKRILFQAILWPGATDEDSNRKAAQEKKNAKSKVRIYETYPIRNFDRWNDESKAQLWVVDVDGSRKARPLFAASALAKARGFAGDSLNAVWAPDGESVIFVATDNGDNQARTKVIAGLWQVPAAGGEPKRLAAEGWDVSAPRVPPGRQGVVLQRRQHETDDLRADDDRVRRLAVGRSPDDARRRPRSLRRELVDLARQQDRLLQRRRHRPRAGLRGAGCRGRDQAGR